MNTNKNKIKKFEHTFVVMFYRLKNNNLRVLLDNDWEITLHQNIGILDMKKIKNLLNTKKIQKTLLNDPSNGYTTFIKKLMDEGEKIELNQDIDNQLESNLETVGEMLDEMEFIFKHGVLVDVVKTS
jgi:hypothetical protein